MSFPNHFFIKTTFWHTVVGLWNFQPKIDTCRFDTDRPVDFLTSRYWFSDPPCRDLISTLQAYLRICNRYVSTHRSYFDRFWAKNRLSPLDFIDFRKYLLIGKWFFAHLPEPTYSHPSERIQRKKLYLNRSDRKIKGAICHSLSLSISIYPSQGTSDHSVRPPENSFCGNHQDH
jgi:hypothetical protein